MVNYMLVAPVSQATGAAAALTTLHLGLRNGAQSERESTKVEVTKFEPRAMQR